MQSTEKRDEPVVRFGQLQLRYYRKVFTLQRSTSGGKSYYCVVNPRNTGSIISAARFVEATNSEIHDFLNWAEEYFR